MRLYSEAEMLQFSQDENGQCWIARELVVTCEVGLCLYVDSWSAKDLTVSRLLLQTWDMTLQWRHDEREGVSNYRRLGCLINRLFKRRLKKTWKTRFTGLCEGNSSVTGEFPAQRASNAENVSIWWRHHDLRNFTLPADCLISTHARVGSLLLKLYRI